MSDITPTVDDPPIPTDNFAQWCWTVHDAALADYNGRHYNDARRRCLLLTNNAYTPYLVAISAYDILSRLTKHYSQAKEYLDKALEMLEDARRTDKSFDYEGRKTYLMLQKRVEMKEEADQKAKDAEEREDVEKSELQSEPSGEATIGDGS